jgi:tetratricopeptide (TPR) repeat protein
VVRSIYWLAYIASLRGEHFLAEQRLGEALALAEQEGSDALIAGIHFAVARLHHLRGRLHETEDALELAMMYAIRSHDMRREGDVYGLQADCRRELGQLEDAYEYLKAATVLFRTLPDEQVALTWLLLELSNIAFELGNDEAATTAREEATSVGGTLESKTSLAKGHFQLADQAVMRSDLAEAKRQLAAGLPLVGTGAEPGNELERMLPQARYLLAAGNADEAEALYASAGQIAQATYRRFQLAEIRLGHARALLALGRLDEARATLMDAEVAFEMFGAQRLLAQACCVWTHYFLAEGRYDAAAAALKRAERIADTLRPAIGRTVEAELRLAHAAVDAVNA